MDVLPCLSTRTDRPIYDSVRSLQDLPLEIHKTIFDYAGVSTIMLNKFYYDAYLDDVVNAKLDSCVWSAFGWRKGLEREEFRLLERNQNSLSYAIYSDTKVIILEMQEGDPPKMSRIANYEVLDGNEYEVYVSGTWIWSMLGFRQYAKMIIDQALALGFRVRPHKLQHLCQSYFNRHTSFSDGHAKMFICTSLLNYGEQVNMDNLSLSGQVSMVYLLNLTTLRT